MPQILFESGYARLPSIELGWVTELLCTQLTRLSSPCGSGYVRLFHCGCPKLLVNWHLLGGVSFKVIVICQVTCAIYPQSLTQPPEPILCIVLHSNPRKLRRGLATCNALYTCRVPEEFDQLLNHVSMFTH